jgi:hypothetical protein
MNMNNWTFETIAIRAESRLGPDDSFYISGSKAAYADDKGPKADNKGMHADNKGPSAYPGGLKIIGDTVLNDAILNIEILGKLSRGDILNTTDDYFTIGQKGWQSVITRTLLNDSRYRALNRIFRCIYTLTEAADHIRESKYLIIYDRMSTRPSDEDRGLFNDRLAALARIGATLRTARGGIDVFLSLYEDDVSLRAKANLLQEYIKNIEHNLTQWCAAMASKKDSWAKYSEANADGLP